jgi:hypothetical protein
MSKMVFQRPTARAAILFERPSHQRDCRWHRVGLHMRDSRAPMITDGTGDPIGLHRPGWRIFSGRLKRMPTVRSSNHSITDLLRRVFRENRIVSSESCRINRL